MLRKRGSFCFFAIGLELALLRSDSKKPPSFADLRALLRYAGWSVFILTFLLHPSDASAMLLSDAALPSALIDIFFGLSTGILLTASLYLFFIWIVIRDRSQVFLMLFLLFLCAHMASTNARLMDLLGLEGGTVRDVMQAYSLILSYIASLFFTYSFLELDMNAPRLRAPLFSFVFLLFALLCLAALNQQIVFFALPTLGTLALAVVIGTGTYMFALGIDGSFSHVLAFSIFLLGGLATPLHQMGYLPDADEAIRFGNFANAAAALMFAVVIAGQFAARQDEKERALVLSNERFALAVKGSNEGLFDWNKKTNEVYFSDLFMKIIGRPLELSPKGLRKWLHAILPSDRSVVLKALRAFRDNAEAHTLNLEYRMAYGENGTRWIHTKAVAVRAAHSGHLTRLTGSISDVTPRKRSDAALRASEARFRSITEAHPVPVMIARLQDLQLVYVSPGAETLLGLPAATLQSHKLDRFLARAEERREILAAMTDGCEINLMEVSVCRGDGEEIPAELSARRINYQNEAAMVVGLNDLSERKKAQAQIAQQQEALMQSEKMAALGGLLAGVAHELNNPLSVVMGQTTLMMETSSDETVRKRSDKIFKAADRCARIVKSFLAIARRKAPERKPMDLNAVIQAALELLSYQFRNESVILHLDLDPTLPSVVGDSDQMTQVFTNLALNAAQAFHEWQGPHNLTFRTGLDGNGMAYARVIDTGPGIPGEIKNRVFEPFFSTKIGHGGTGVGLSLCLSIIESHGGKIQIENTEGGGATFYITLPLARTETLAPEANGEEAIKSSTGEKKRLLLVDDEVELSQTLADLLEPEGYEIDLAANGAIALQKLQKTAFDAIVSDLRMPVLDGPSLFEELAKSLPVYTKRIIFVTGDTLSPRVNQFLSDNAVPVIEKPYRTIDVKKALGALFAAEKTGNA